MELTTCLWFNGQAKAAANFYTQLFPNSQLDEQWASPVDTPGNTKEEFCIINFKIFGHQFMAIDGGPQFPHTEAISFQIPCKDQAEIDMYWEKLTADGGAPGQCGWLKDKFGVSWQVVSPELNKILSGPDQEGVSRAMTAMLQMQKIDLATMKNAYDGK
jgi:predicted 3-demethylubiquinone-9 3-methyltransferase (glyoxalase superfamily)